MSESFAGRRILITGASGFVGRHLCAQLARALPDAVLHTARVDICDAEAVAAMVGAVRPNVCVHLAAIAAIPVAQRNEARAWQVNLHGALHVAHAILRHVPACQMLFISSADAYGATFRGGIALDETALLAPMNLYGATKAAADLALGAMAERGLRVVRLRAFNHTGPGQSADFAPAAFARQLARIAAGLQPPVIQVGNLEARRDFLDVRDICAAYVACIRRHEALPPGTVLNLASGSTRRIADVLDGLREEAGVAVEVRVDAGRLRASDIPVACGDATAARALLDWRPGIDWRQTLRDTLADWQVRVRQEAAG